MPTKLVEAFKKNRRAKASFDALTLSRQKEILRYIGSLKSERAIEKNVARVIGQLSGSDEDPPIFMRNN